MALYEDMGKDEHIFIDIEADSLRKLVSILEIADFFFGNEGGPRHIAQACHLPGLAIYPPWVELPRWLPSNDSRYKSVSPFDMFPGQVIEGRTEKELFDLLSVGYVLSLIHILTFMEGCGYTLELARNKNLKVELPEGVTLESKPTTDKNTVLETGFIGNKKYARCV